MKNTKARNAGFLACALALVGLLGTAAPASAQSRDRRDVLSNASHERMRQWAHELDAIAQRANRQAQAQQAGYRGFRRDSNFLKSIDHFADRAERFHERMDSYRERPWNVDEEIVHLIRDARNVQTRISRARFVDSRTRREWDRVLSLLDRMSNEYRTAVHDGYGRYPADRYPNGRYPDDRYRYPDGRDSDSRVSGDLRQLAYELEQRAARISDLMSRSAHGRYDDDGAEEIREFRDEARDFRNRIDSNRMSRSEARSRVNRLLEDARDAYDEIRENRYSGEVVREWESIVNVLDRMRDLA